jgi:hypothetical protein
MLDWGFAGFDVRHRLAVSGIWVLPIARNASGFTKALAADWQLNWIFTARTGFPFTIFDCTNAQFAVCMRAQDPVGIDKNATDGPATDSPNEFTLLDLSPIAGSFGSYVHPLTGNSEFGPWPSDMTERNAFRGPGHWNLDFSLIKRVRFGTRAVQFRAEAYNLFNHANMFVRGSNADVSSFSTITGFRENNRRVQLAAKFEF